MARDKITTERLRALLSELRSATTEGNLHWEHQRNSDRRYTKWSGNMLVIGPHTPAGKGQKQWYLFITPLASHDTTEIHSHDAELGEDLLALMQAVDLASLDDPEIDPFDASTESLHRPND